MVQPAGARIFESWRAHKRALGIASALLAVALLLAVVLARRSQPRAPQEEDGAPLERASESGRIPVIDVHVHLSPQGLERLESLMARYGFDHVVNLSGGSPLQGLDAQLEAARQLPGRISVFTTLAYGQARFHNYGERMAYLLRVAHERGAVGLKIAKLLGLGLTRADGTLMPVDDPGLDPVFEAAGALGMPVAIHSGDPEAFWLPVDANNPRRAELEAHPGWAQYGRDVPSFDALLDQLERRIGRHPGTTFISVHFGNAAERPERVAQMLRRHPNLYIDTAARIPEMGRHPPALMRSFFVEFQDRILYGSDLGVGAPDTPLFLGSEGPEPATREDEERFFSASRRYFETAEENFDHPTPIQGNWKISGIALPRRILEKIYHENAERVLGLDSRFLPRSGSGTPSQP